jgi:hypothetical protein
MHYRQYTVSKESNIQPSKRLVSVELSRGTSQEYELPHSRSFRSDGTVSSGVITAWESHLWHSRSADAGMAFLILNCG